jgi:hypothetical protein
MNAVKHSGGWGVPARPSAPLCCAQDVAVALSAASPRFAAGFPLQSLTRNAATIIRLFVIIPFLGSCSDHGESATQGCIAQFTLEEDIQFVNAEGYCRCVMPKLVEYCDAKGIDLDTELNNKRFYHLVREHPELDRYVQECRAANPPDDLSRKVVLSEKLKQSLVRKYALPLQGTEVERTHDINGLCRCLVDSTDGNVTVGEFIDPSFYRSARYMRWIEACKQANVKN